MFPSFARDTITRLRLPLVDDGHGNEIPDTNLEHANEADVARCNAQPGASQEYLAGRDSTLIAWTVLAPAAADVEATDLVRFRGDVYAIDGEPARWDSPSGSLAHTVILLKRWEG